MSDLTREIDATVAALAADPASSEHVGIGRAVLVLSVPPDRVLWASESAADLRASMEAPDGRLHAGLPALDRLHTLARDLKSDLVTVVERIPLRPGGADLTVAFRRLHLSGGDALLAALVRRDDEPSRHEAVPEHLSRDLAASDEAPVASDAADRVRSLGLRRFIWSTDRDGRFTSVSAPLGEVVGDESASIVGRLWADLLGATVIDEGDVIAGCIARRATWSNETVLWRVAGTDLVVPVELGGMPVFGRSRELEGYRGFGLCRAEDVRRGPFSVAGGQNAGQEEQPASSRRFAPAVEDAELTFEPSAERPSLTESEQGALREIARALGAKVEQDDTEASETPTAEIVPLVHPGREPDLVKVLDRLPVGIMALRGEIPIFVNRFALDLLQYPSTGILRAEGGASRIFAGRLPGDGSRATPLVTREGATIDADVRLTTVEWGEQAASVVLIRPRDGGTPAVVDKTVRASGSDLELTQRTRSAERMLALTGIAAVTLDEGGRIVSLNGAAEALLGRRITSVAGDSVTAILPVGVHRAAIALLDEARTAGPDDIGREIEVAIDDRVIGAKTLLLRVGRLSNGDGTRFGVLMRDATADRAVRRELEEARRNAEEESARRAEFLARVSHEIRTPLNAIIGFTDLMAKERFGPIGNERYRAYLKDIHDSGRHVVSLVDDLLDLAKASSGKVDLTFASLDLGQVAGQAVGIMQATATQGRIVLRASYAAGLPRIAADERSIRQIVINVLANAIRFTPAGGQVIVSTSLTDRREVMLRVRDTGPGMSAEEIDTALTPFRQLPTAGRPGGTGLGLPLSKALTEANHGTFVIRSARRQGTMVELVFPTEKP